METFKTTTRWKRTTNDFLYENYNRAHEIELTNAIIKSSAALNYKGDVDRTNPEEMLTAAISSCHMLTFLAICSKSGITVESYEDDAVAIMDKGENNIISVTEVNLHPHIVFSGEKIPDQEMLNKFHEKAHRNCFIANSVKCKINIVF